MSKNTLCCVVVVMWLYAPLCLHYWLHVAWRMLKLLSNLKTHTYKTHTTWYLSLSHSLSRARSLSLRLRAGAGSVACPFVSYELYNHHGRIQKNRNSSHDVGFAHTPCHWYENFIILPLNIHGALLICSVWVFQLNMLSYSLRDTGVSSSSGDSAQVSFLLTGIASQNAHLKLDTSQFTFKLHSQQP